MTLPNTHGMEHDELLTLVMDAFPGSKIVCRVCRADATDAYCENCTGLTTFHIGESAKKPKKWTECDKCGSFRLGVHASKKCYGHKCDGEFVVSEIQPTFVKKAKKKKARREMVAA